MQAREHVREHELGDLAGWPGLLISLALPTQWVAPVPSRSRRRAATTNAYPTGLY